MKKILFTALAVMAMCLISCDSTSKQSDEQSAQVNTETSVSTEQTQDAGDVQTNADSAAPKGLTGDMEKDATAIVDASLKISLQMTEGTDQAAEQAKVQKLLEAAKEYYGKQGKTDEFAKLVNDKMTKGITDLALKMKTEKAH